MPSVTQVVRTTRQPRGGYLNPREMCERDFSDGSSLRAQENVSPALMGLIVDYMSRYMLNGDPVDAFRISLSGAQALDGFARGRHSIRARALVRDICGLDATAIAAAYQLVAYDSAFRAGPHTYVDVSGKSPDADTTHNAITMVERTLRFIDMVGPIVADGMTFPGGYTQQVSTGDADFCTRDTLWDMKVSKRPPTKNHTLQLMMYWLMGRKSGIAVMRGVTVIGVWNPRLNEAWTKPVNEIGDEVLRTIEQQVLGY